MSLSPDLLPFLFALLFSSSSAAGDVPSLIKRFRVDLDLPPKDRWLPVLNAFRESEVVPRLIRTVRSFLPENVRSPLFWIFGKLLHFLPYEFAEEIKGMAAHLEGQVHLGELVLLNVFYDLFDFAHAFGLDPPSNRSLPSVGCTSILTADLDGQILHGRNLDYGWTQLLREATIVVDYVRDGRVQFTGIQFVLYSGLLTGQRPHAFTLSLNARYSGSPWDNLLMALITRFRHPIAFELRKVLETVGNYQEAVDNLSRIITVAPSYLIVGGRKGDGAIISRDRFGAADVFFLDYLHHRWFLVETNSDPWERTTDKRRTKAAQCLRLVGQRLISPIALSSRVLAIPPVRNEQTIFTTVMSAEQPNLIYNFTKVWPNAEHFDL
ncbi:hypothetical protein niasHS_010766 [Heterodera schachtii]|uniref:N-acylethanolamine-hydrolyzing acid amidase n=1 Tax=Heterodera schachtii TaxID=97005 RepID=A0ABD2ISI3_HETSC